MTALDKFLSNVARHAAVLVICAIASLNSDAAAAGALPEGKKAITLIAADGSTLALGTVTFIADADASTFDVALDAPEFAEEFLSMRPFRCLAGAKETWCHLPYPYETEKRIAANDLADLEYALLFLFKPPAGYGIDAWNGLYFKLAMDNDGNLDGTLHEADFNVLAVPPERGNLRPVEHSALTPVTAGAHRFSRLEIR